MLFLIYFQGLKFLVRLFNDQGLINEGKEYANKLNKLEKSLAQKDQVYYRTLLLGSQIPIYGSAQHVLT